MTHTRSQRRRPVVSRPDAQGTLRNLGQCSGSEMIGYQRIIASRMNCSPIGSVSVTPVGKTERKSSACLFVLRVLTSFMFSYEGEMSVGDNIFQIMFQSYLLN